MNHNRLSSSPRIPLPAAGPTLVLAEDDSDMWLATVAFPEPPAAGATFHFRGQVWQVVEVATPGCRAEPVLM